MDTLRKFNSINFKKGRCNYLLLALALVVVALLASNVSAVAPITGVSFGDTGIQVEVLTPITIPTSTEINVSFHAYNKSNGRLLPVAIVSCEGLLVNQYGYEVAHQSAVVHENHFVFTLNETHATTNGEYPYAFHCNTSEIGGFYSSYFDATGSGTSITVQGGIITTGIMIMLIIIALFVFGMGYVTAQPGIKLFFSLIGFLLMFLALGSGRILLDSIKHSIGFQNIITAVMFILGILFVIIMYFVLTNQTRRAFELMRAKQGFEGNDDPELM